MVGFIGRASYTHFFFISLYTYLEYTGQPTVCGKTYISIIKTMYTKRKTEMIYSAYCENYLKIRKYKFSCNKMESDKMFLSIVVNKCYH